MSTNGAGPGPGSTRSPRSMKALRRDGGDAGDNRDSSRVAAGVSLRLAGRLAGGLLSLVMFHLLAARLGPKGLGPVIVGLAWSVVFSSLTGFGTARAVNREMARPGAGVGPIFRHAVWLSLVSAVVTMVPMGGIGLLAYRGEPPVRGVVLALVPVLVGQGLISTSGAALAGLGAVHPRALADVASSLLSLGTTVLVLAEHRGAVAWALGYAASYAVTALGLLAWARRRVAAWEPLPGDTATVEVSRQVLWRIARPLGTMDLLNSLYLRVDVLLLAAISGARAVAVYGVAYQVAAFAMGLPALVSTVLVPALLKLDSSRREELLRACLRAATALAIIAPILAIVAAPEAVRVIGGGQFQASAVPFAVLGGAIGLTFVNGFLTDASVFAGAERNVARVVGLVLVVNLVSNLVLIPLYAARGAAIAMVASELVACIGNARTYRRSVGSLRLRAVTHG